MRSSHKTILVLLGVAFLVACANMIPRKGWNKNYGPVVPHDSFPGDCSMCHEGGSWSKIKPDFEYDHLKETGVALLGAHATAQCLMCHNDRGPVKQYADRGCAGCHEDVHRGRQGSQCADCHNENTWRPLEIIARHMQTRFPLVGAHAAADCTSCHANAADNNFEVASVSCESCHAGDAARSTTINHASLGLTDRCDRCHNPVAWLPAGFSHPDSFPLQGGHGGQSCSACHTTPGVFTGLTTDCNSCHNDEYQATNDPNHVTAGFGTNCTQCHSINQWEGAVFNHTSTFPLTSGHAGRSCVECHTTPGVYTGLSTACASCHLDDFQATTDPDHEAGAFSTNCTDCHTTSRWQGGSFIHPSTFPLTNGHSNRTCSTCHTTPGVFTGLATACSSCHLDEFQATTSPDHETGGFSTNCTDCHNTTQWQGASFVHTSTFPLTNGHAGRSCTNCHTTPGVYTGLTTACSSCHLDDYQATTDPNHTNAGFSTNCTQCHTTSQWLGATFLHPSSFPLTQAHAGRTCTECHTTPGVYTGESTACVSCHLADYQATTNPNHAQLGYPTNCTTCHTPTVWANGTFNHPNINRGNHSGLSCADCHTVPAATPAFSCTHCHEHNQADMADRHRDVNNYQWVSSRCYNCHD
jgi:Cytochrome c7 and related cytochrome c